jgi:hypothetical protein
LARGRYVAILHDDDWVDSRYLSTLIPPLEAQPQTVLAFTDPWHVSADGQIDAATTDHFFRLTGRAELEAGYYQPFSGLVVRECLPLPGSVFRREALSPADFPSAVGAAHDIWAGFLLAMTGGAAYYSSERLVYYRVHDDREFAANPLVYYEDALYCERRMLEDPRLQTHRAAMLRRVALRQHFVGARLLRRGSRRSARSHLAAAIRIRPSLKGVGAWAASWILPRALLARL